MLNRITGLTEEKEKRICLLNASNQGSVKSVGIIEPGFTQGGTLFMEESCENRAKT